MIGNALEWYDFIVYSFMTTYIARLFFPSMNSVNSLLAATATFGAAFLMRPAGAVFFGVYADKYGRKAAITLIIAIMAVALLLIALVPTYASIGEAASILIIAARFLQGFSAGGEFGPSTALLIELAPPGRRGLYGSWQMFGQVLAMLIGAVIGILLTKKVSSVAMEAWGWRIPFLIGLVIAPVGFYIRSHLHEKNNNAQEKNNYLHLVKNNLGNMLLAMGLVVGGTTSFYVNLIYMPTYASKYLGLSMTDAFIALACGSLASMLLVPCLGALSDRIGRKLILVASLLLYLITILPCFIWLTHSPSALKLLAVEVIFCVCMSGYLGVYATVLAGLFPHGMRATGLSISNNLVIMLFGGFGQFIVTWLIKVSGSLLAPGYYVSFGVIVTLLCAVCLSNKDIYECN